RSAGEGAVCRARDAGAQYELARGLEAVTQRRRVLEHHESLLGDQSGLLAGMDQRFELELGAGDLLERAGRDHVDALEIRRDHVLGETRGVEAENADVLDRRLAL